MDERIRRPEVDSDVAREQAEQTVQAKHDEWLFLLRGAGRPDDGEGLASLGSPGDSGVMQGRG
jgi:hypothetical protein